MKVVLVTPPMLKPNTPYAATPHLMGFLRQHQARLGLEVAQVDLSLELFLTVFTQASLRALIEETRRVVTSGHKLGPSELRIVTQVLEHADAYANDIEPAIRFLQGKDPTLATRIAGRGYLPEGPAFDMLNAASTENMAPPEAPGSEAESASILDWGFGALGIHDQAAHIATLFLNDVAAFIAAVACPQFRLDEYAESLTTNSQQLDSIHERLAAPADLIDAMLDQLTATCIANLAPDLVCVTTPFPGNVYGAFRVAKRLRELVPTAKIAWGGGFINTELRTLSDARVFNYFDYVMLDDGERPLLCLIEALATKAGQLSQGALFRTFVLEGGVVTFKSSDAFHDIPHRDVGTPSYDGLRLERYVSTFPVLNPMQRLWSDGHWNKIMVAHGCYWKKCSFCDVTLDYIGRYDPAAADVIVDRIDALRRETGRSGFHLVDEAAPPSGLKAMSEQLVARGLTVSWWGNIRFEKTFTPELAALMARAGCIAVSGGLEVASDRLLKLINKGVTVDQVARVTKALSDAGILVHAYLMYGFPSQTVQETIDSLELVRQLFEAGCINSGYWHRFNATIHSPIGKAPQLFGIKLRSANSNFRNYEVGFVDAVEVDHNLFTKGLNMATYNFMHGLGTDQDVRTWFEASLQATLPAPTVAANQIELALHAPA